MELTMITKKIISALFERFVSIYGKKFTHDFDGKPERLVMWVEDWFDGLLGIPPETFKDAIRHVKMNMTWPPSLPEFRSLCERSMGLPSQHEVLQAGVRKDFYHPLIKNVYDKVGSFNFHQATEEKLIKLISLHYPEELAKLRNETYEACVKQIGHTLKTLELE